MACWKEHQSAECLGESNLTVEALCRRMLILDDKKEVWEVHQEDGVEFDPEGQSDQVLPLLLLRLEERCVTRTSR